MAIRTIYEYLGKLASSGELPITASYVSRDEKQWLIQFNASEKIQSCTEIWMLCQENCEPIYCFYDSYFDYIERDMFRDGMGVCKADCLPEVLADFERDTEPQNVLPFMGQGFFVDFPGGDEGITIGMMKSGLEKEALPYRSVSWYHSDPQKSVNLIKELLPKFTNSYDENGFVENYVENKEQLEGLVSAINSLLLSGSAIDCKNYHYKIVNPNNTYIEWDGHYCRDTGTRFFMPETITRQGDSENSQTRGDIKLEDWLRDYSGRVEQNLSGDQAIPDFIKFVNISNFRRRFCFGYSNYDIEYHWKRSFEVGDDQFTFQHTTTSGTIMSLISSNSSEFEVQVAIPSGRALPGGYHFGLLKDFINENATKLAEAGFTVRENLDAKFIPKILQPKLEVQTFNELESSRPKRAKVKKLSPENTM